MSGTLFPNLQTSTTALKFGHYRLTPLEPPQTLILGQTGALVEDTKCCRHNKDSEDNNIPHNNRVNMLSTAHMHSQRSRSNSVPMIHYTNAANWHHESKRDVLDRILAEQDMDRGLAVTYVDRLVHCYNEWQKLLPRTEIYYAVKAFCHPAIISVLHKLNCKFDVASVAELNTCMTVGVSATDIIGSHPYKPMNQLHLYKKLGVPLMVVDSESELDKIMSVYPSVKILLRVKSAGAKSIFNLDDKFGATNKQAQGLLVRGRKLGANIVGVSFHGGSGSKDTTCHARSIAQVRPLFDYAKDKVGYNLSILNIGGGFPGGHETEQFHATAQNINKALEQYFPEHTGVKVIAEPGTYFADPSTDLYACVIGKRETTYSPEELKSISEQTEEIQTAQNINDATEGYSYVLSDGVYGALNYSLHRNTIDRWSIVDPAQKKNSEHPGILWGPTCDSLDKLTRLSMIPDMDLGTWLVERNSGAYSLCLHTDFNGIPSTRHVIVAGDKYYNGDLSQNFVNEFIPKEKKCRQDSSWAYCDIERH